jgi:glycosyltransferase involved in cell wall biosynthesis
VADPLLSICLPIYNQASLFKHQLNSLTSVSTRVKECVEFLVVDDCSTDDLGQEIAALEEDEWLVRYMRNEENLGRAASLAKAVRAASGRYVMIMDGDDPFVADGLEGIVDELRGFALSSGRGECLGLVFGTLIKDGERTRTNGLRDGLECTLLALRADHQVVGDLKEVIERRYVVSALCPLFDEYRRVPTSLLWARISGQGTVRCSSKIVVEKSYAEGGLTRNLNAHRKASLPPLLMLYSEIADSRSYRSLRYRFRASVNYHRFLVWHRRGEWRHRLDFFGTASLLGTAIGNFERVFGAWRSRKV